MSSVEIKMSKQITILRLKGVRVTATGAFFMKKQSFMSLSFRTEAQTSSKRLIWKTQ
jgi:hypothetical protein